MTNVGLSHCWIVDDPIFALFIFLMCNLKMTIERVLLSLCFSSRVHKDLLCSFLLLYYVTLDILRLLRSNDASPTWETYDTEQRSVVFRSYLCRYDSPSSLSFFFFTFPVLFALLINFLNWYVV